MSSYDHCHLCMISSHIGPCPHNREHNTLSKVAPTNIAARAKVKLFGKIDIVPMTFREWLEKACLDGDKLRMNKSREGFITFQNVRTKVVYLYDEGNQE